MATTAANFISNALYKFSKTPEEKQTSELLFNDTLVISMGDMRLNNIAALTFNMTSCDRVFNVIEKTISPTEYPHTVLYKSLLLIHTIVLYGSELAIDRCIKLCPFLQSLPEYNSATVKKNTFGITFSSGGTDNGAYVRSAAKALIPILSTDNAIRNARNQVRGGQSGILIPMGNDTYTPTTSHTTDPYGTLNFGQGLDTSIGQKYGMEKIPGMYDNRPERYFDNSNDPRKRNVTTGDHQSTRDKLAPSLLDLAFDDFPSVEHTAGSGSRLPEAQYLPALEREQDLKRQLDEQKQQLAKLQALAAMNSQQFPVQYAPVYDSSINNMYPTTSSTNSASIGSGSNIPMMMSAGPMVANLSHTLSPTMILQQQQHPISMGINMGYPQQQLQQQYPSYQQQQQQHRVDMGGISYTPQQQQQLGMGVGMGMGAGTGMGMGMGMGTGMGMVAPLQQQMHQQQQQQQQQQHTSMGMSMVGGQPYGQQQHYQHNMNSMQGMMPTPYTPYSDDSDLPPVPPPPPPSY